MATILSFNKHAARNRETGLFGFSEIERSQIESVMDEHLKSGVDISDHLYNAGHSETALSIYLNGDLQTPDILLCKEKDAEEGTFRYRLTFNKQDVRCDSLSLGGMLTLMGNHLVASIKQPCQVLPFQPK